MRIKIFVLALSVITLSGCATTKLKNQQVQELQNRVATLQTELDQSREDIATLKDELTQSKASQKMKVAANLSLSARDVQNALKSAGFYEGPVDGKIGPRTKDAIVQFQEANGLKADGVVGRQTTQELGRYLE